MLQVSEKVARFYKNEMALEDGDALQLFVRHGGIGIGGYALGVEKSFPRDLDIKQTIEGITFFARPDDLWFLDQLELDCDEQLSELKLSFIAS
ncbi:HesB/YadR/YfhF family protein [Scopulibacillus cellulosilyticus]|uniref:HesB/YadR/YfhF family protein n=1 Tax=Scopulibacillus cellulosilyticus TaxID=2665665 RepID=A0ABW2PXI4_9BACL